MRIVVSGSLSIDQIMSFEGSYADLIQADKLHTLSISPLVSQFRKTRGGTAGNIVYSLSLLKEPAVLYASIGKEDRAYINSLSKLGVDTSLVHYSSLPTATFSVLTDRYNCQVGGFYPGAMMDSGSLEIGNFKNEAVLIVIGPHDPKQMASQVRDCARYQKTLVFDVGQQVFLLSKADLLAALKIAKVLILNDYEMGAYVKKTGLTEIQIIHSVETCVVTLGASGSVAYTSGDAYQAHRVKAALVKKVVDPTGAGDGYRAGFLYGYVRDWPLEKSMRLASIVAAFVVEKQGTQAHNFSLEQITQRYQKTYKQALSLS